MRISHDIRRNRHHIVPVTITHVREINTTTRVLRLSPTNPNHTIKVRYPSIFNKQRNAQHLTQTPVPPRPMARHLHSYPPESRRVYHNLSPPPPPSPNLTPTLPATSNSPCKTPRTLPPDTSTAPSLPSSTPSSQSASAALSPTRPQSSQFQPETLPASS